MAVKIWTVDMQTKVASSKVKEACETSEFPRTASGVANLALVGKEQLDHRHVEWQGGTSSSESKGQTQKLLVPCSPADSFSDHSSPDLQQVQLEVSMAPRNVSMT